MIKKWAIFFLTLVLFTGTATAANSCSSPDDTILRLSSATNAHAELYSGTTTSYNEEICFSQLFPNAQTPTTPHPTCDSTNTILKLSAPTNAHAEDITQGNYNTNVCYGDLGCSVRNSCQQGETAILKLSSQTNAHLENASQSNYGYSLCCAVGGVSGGSQALWLNSTGQEVTTARVGDEVFATFTNYGGNPDSSFNITEVDDNSVDEIINQGGSASGNDWRLKWTIAPADLNPTTDYDNFTFEINTNFSRDLEVTFCGDNKVQTSYGEQCDDGNNVDGDGCSSTCQIEGTGDRQWFDLNGNSITTAEQGDVVELRYIGNTNGDDFNIKEDDTLFDDDIVTITGIPNSQNTAAIWTIPTGTLGNDLEEEYELYFEINGGNSYNLNVSGQNNDDPTGDFITPTCGTDFQNATQENINFTVSDTDSLLDITLTVNDEEVFSQTSQGGTFSVPHLFTTESGEEGITEIILRASETNGQGKVKATSNVIVYNSTDGVRYVAACIKEPKDYSNIVTDYAFFNASTTRAVNYSSVSNSVNDLPFSDLYFDWVFSDGRDHPDNDGANLISREFHKYFNQFGNNWANLKVTFK